MVRDSAQDKASETHRVLMRGLLESHPEDAAEILERLPPGECASVLAGIPPQLGASVALRMSRLSGARCLETMPPGEGAALVSNMPPHAAAALIRCLDRPAQERVLMALSPEHTTRLGALVTSLGGTVGALMDTQILTVPEGASIREARELFRRFMRATSVTFYGYVVGSDQTIKGVLSAREMLLARGTDRLAIAMRRPVASVRASDTPAGVLHRSEWGTLRVLPVVDDAGVLLGQIHHDVLRRDVEARSTASRHQRVELSTLFMLIVEGYCKGLVTLLKGLALAVSQPEGERR